MDNRLQPLFRPLTRELVVPLSIASAANIGAGGGGGGGEDSVTFNGVAVTYQSSPVTYTPGLWLYRGQRVTYQGAGVTL